MTPLGGQKGQHGIRKKKKAEVTAYGIRINSLEGEMGDLKCHYSSSSEPS